jgi:23S rRNA (pseudouridine1915-N3)-methyltransferase
MTNGQSGHILIAAVGKLKRREWRAAQDDYMTRLNRYTDATLQEVKDAVGRGFPDAVAMQREGEALLKATADSQRRILLSADGRVMTSKQLARFLQEQIELYGRVAFLVGGPLGFAPEVEEGADGRLSLSRLTFPHELARIMLLEQLYRGFTILRGEPYHK